MIKKVATIDNFEYTIKRPIEVSIVKYLKNQLFKHNDIYTEYLNDYEDSEFNTDKELYNNQPKYEYLEISSEIESDEENMLANTILRYNHKPILIDNDVMFFTYPNTIWTRFIIKFRYHNRSKNAIVKKVNELKFTRILDNAYGQLDASYYYTIPDNLLDLIHAIYERKELNISFGEYLKSIASASLDFINSKTGNRITPVIRETQPVIGNYESSLFDTNKIEKDDFGWYIEFDYRIDIELPMSLLVEYEPLVYNKPIPEVFIPKTPIIRALESSSKYVESLYELIEYNAMHHRDSYPIIFFPFWDSEEFLIPTKQNMYRLISVLCVVGGDDLITTVDELTMVIKNKIIMDYIRKSIGRKLFLPYQSILHFELFEYGNIVDKKLYMNELGEIRAGKPLDKKKTYRLVLNIVTDLNTIKANTIEAEWSYVEKVINELNINIERVNPYAVTLDVMLPGVKETLMDPN